MEQFKKEEPTHIEVNNISVSLFQKPETSPADEIRLKSHESEKNEMTIEEILLVMIKIK